MSSLVGAMKIHEVLIEDNPVGYFKVLYLSDELISADGLSPTEVA